jgi:4-hydroxy-2-oxoheptanedioate aldolase
MGSQRKPLPLKELEAALLDLPGWTLGAEATISKEFQFEDFATAFGFMTQIAKAGSIAPAVTPLVRIPVNGIEMAQWHAKQALDMGCYGVVFPHISSVEEAANAVGACRYPRLKSAATYEPPGIRGDGPTAAARYWGVSQQEYYQKADVWPLNPKGEIFVILQMEDTKGIENLDAILTKVPGIGAILIGEGDLGQELGYPRQYEHPELLKWMARVVDTCKKHNVIVGHPHVESGNVERIVSGAGGGAGPPRRRYTSVDVSKSSRAPQALKPVPIDRNVLMTTGVAIKIKHTSHTQSVIKPLSSRRPRPWVFFGVEPFMLMSSRLVSL